jgi:hypothetical protein
MKRMSKIRIHKLFVLIVVFCFTSSAYAQLSQLGALVAVGKDDASKLLSAYLKPFGNSLGANLSAGWYNTAKVHKLGGFDLTFSLSFAMVPAADKSFDPSKIGLSQYVTIAPVGKMAPTLSGSTSPPTISYAPIIAGTTYTIASFNTPKGIGVGFVASPILQLSIGLIKETALSFRYVPTTKWGNSGSIGLWGIGIQHGLKQWIPIVSRVPFLNLTFQAGYTKLTSGTNISIKPIDISSEDQTGIPNMWDGQKMHLNVSNFTANVIASIDVPVISVYGGIGISSSKTDMSLLGNYPIPSNYDFVTNKGIVNISNAPMMKDPIQMHIGSNDGSLTKPRLSAGLKIKLGPVQIHGDYTYAYYSILSAGIGISIR